MYYYNSCKDDSQVEDKIMELAFKHPAEGQDKIYYRIRNQGILWNKKRVRRVYLRLSLHKHMKKRKRLPARIKEPLFIPGQPNEVWSMDFMHDSLQNGRKFRVLNVLDDYNREVLAIEPHLSIGSKLVTQVLDQIVHEKGLPKVIRVDNGPEFIATTLGDWCKERKIRLQFIQPGKPTQNGYIERFNRTYRQNILDAYSFDNLYQVRILSEEWMNEYNYTRPHDALKGKSPVQYRLTNQSIEASFDALITSTIQQMN